MFHSFFQKIRLDRRRLFDALRFAKFFDAPTRAVERLLGRLRDLASESLDGFDCRGHSLDHTIDARVACLRALFRHDFPPPQNVLPDMAKLNDLK
jgi:hypothetical protein